LDFWFLIGWCNHVIDRHVTKIKKHFLEIAKVPIKSAITRNKDDSYYHYDNCNIEYFHNSVGGEDMRLEFELHSGSLFSASLMHLHAWYIPWI
jgi:hypothetical protein